MKSRETILVPPVVHYGGQWATVPELMFEKKELILAVAALIESMVGSTRRYLKPLS